MFRQAMREEERMMIYAASMVDINRLLAGFDSIAKTGESTPIKSQRGTPVPF